MKKQFYIYMFNHKERRHNGARTQRRNGKENYKQYTHETFMYKITQQENETNEGSIRTT
jgi:hypothetical protein